MILSSIRERSERFYCRGHFKNPTFESRTRRKKPKASRTTKEKPNV